MHNNPKPAVLSGLYLLLLLAAVSSVSADSTYGYDAYIQWDQLPTIKHGVQTHLASSYDRNGGNYDYSWYESPAGRVTYATTATVKTIPGPGVLYRIWMPHLMTTAQAWKTPTTAAPITTGAGHAAPSQMNLKAPIRSPQPVR